MKSLGTIKYVSETSYLSNYDVMSTLIMFIREFIVAWTIRSTTIQEKTQASDH